MAHLRNKKILDFLSGYIEEKITDVSVLPPDDLGCSTNYIAQKTGILRNNVSMELNLAFKRGIVIKIIGKPVLYIDKTTFENKYNIKISSNLFKNFDDLRNTISEGPLNKSSLYSGCVITTCSDVQQTPIKISNNVFDSLIGIEDDLSTQVKQAKAAIFYPPNGLHTLITGPTGSGKTTFANIMYRYAVETNKLSTKAPFIVFNCSDYAENTQLLLSHLFGHTRGAYTGAVKETIGLVGQANGGILFLDEIHRLPPEGQEMLFSLIDHGKYRKLGETGTYHTATVLIIAATTENPQSAILKTFFRRIPILITLPGLNERSLKVRMKLINHFFQTESQIIKKPLTVSREVLKVLLSYNCSGNIGQLHNDIQVLCATAFIEATLSHVTEDTIHIKLSHINDNLKNEFFQSSFNRQEFYKTFKFDDIKNITFSKNIDQFNNLFQENDCNTDNNLYEYILKTAKYFYKNGSSINDIKEKIYSKLAFPRNITNKSNIKIDKDILNKIINTDLINIIKNNLSASNIFDSTDNKMIYSLALHLELLKDRLENGQLTTIINVKEIIAKYTDEFKLAQKICNDINKFFELRIPLSEVAVIASFFHTLKQNQLIIYPIIVICHGRNTATSMADVVKNLIGNPEIYPIDMPLDAKISTILNIAINLVKSLNSKRGLLMLVDMGSLMNFAEIISNRTNLVIKTMGNISTPLLLEAARRCMMPNTTLDKIISSLNNPPSAAQIIFDESPMFPFYKNIDANLLSQLISSLSDITIFIDVKKAVYLLSQTLNKLLSTYKLNISESFFVKFIFHSICMLERVIRKESLPYKNVYKKKTLDLFYIMRENFIILEENYGISIPDTEIAYIVDLFLLNFPEVMNLQRCVK